MNFTSEMSHDDLLAAFEGKRGGNFWFFKAMKIFDSQFARTNLTTKEKLKTCPTELKMSLYILKCFLWHWVFLFIFFSFCNTIKENFTVVAEKKKQKIYLVEIKIQKHFAHGRSLKLMSFCLYFSWKSSPLTSRFTIIHVCFCDFSFLVKHQTQQTSTSEILENSIYVKSHTKRNKAEKFLWNSTR